MQASSDGIGSQERELINFENKALSKETDRIAESTSFLGTSLLNGSGKELTFQIGAFNNKDNRINFDASDLDIRTKTLGVDDIDLSSKQDARDSLEKNR